MADKQEFLKIFDQIPAQFPLQGDARAAIHNGLEFPTTRDEYWKYTRIGKLINTDYSTAEASIESIEEFKIPNLDAYYFVFVNGVFNAALSDTSFEDGLSVQNMASVEGETKDLMLANLGKYVDAEKHAFTALNTSYFQDGAFILVGDNAEVSKPICLLHVATGEQPAANQRNLVLVGKNAKAQVVSQYVGKNNSGSLSNAVTEVAVSEGASGHLYILQNEGQGSAQINTTQISQKRDSNFSVMTVTLDGDLVRNNLNFSITDQGCESNLYGLYFTSGKQHVDNHTYADHQMPNCNSNELYKGVMADSSTGVFNGKIMVHQDAQQTNAFQSNQNILLTDKASVNTKPELEIYADDVKCSHGCTIGQLDEEAMFYLQSRGLGKEAATKLLLQAFAADVLEIVEIDAVKDYLSNFIESKFK